MTRPDCISNRNLKIIDAYVKSRLGREHDLFKGLAMPEGYPSPESFFLNEDQWTTYDNFDRVFRRARELVGEPNFFFDCGASSAHLRSWGRFHYFVRVFASPGDGYKRLPFFNEISMTQKPLRLYAHPPTIPRQESSKRS